MPPDSSDRYLDPYRDAVRRHGPSFEATLWSNPEAQLVRFDVMIDLLDLEDRVIIDLGCGRGDFAEHLARRKVPFDAYVGIDALGEVIEWASEQDRPRCTFVRADAVADPTVITAHAPAVVCMSGVLNTMDDETARRLVQSGFDAASEAVAFNFLSDRPHPRFLARDTTPARRFDTVAWLDWALGLSSRVAMTQAYFDGHDATIVVWHDGEVE